jgi:hypothetical protein
MLPVPERASEVGFHSAGGRAALRHVQALLSDILTLRANGKRRLSHTQTHRTCYLCRRVLVASEFTRRSNGSYFSACKECNTHVFAQRCRARLVQAEGEYTVREWLYLLAQHPIVPAAAGFERTSCSRWISAVGSSLGLTQSPFNRPATWPS